MEVNLLGEQENRLTIKFIAAKTEISAIPNFALRIKTAPRIIKGGITGKVSLFRVPLESTFCVVLLNENSQNSHIFRRMLGNHRQSRAACLRDSPILKKD